MVTSRTRLLSVAIAYGVLGVTTEAANMHYPSNPEGLVQAKFIELPLGAIRPRGWLKDQLVIQGDGLTGHLDEFWPSLSQSAWKGGSGDAWERGPYYLDGLVALAYLLEDERLIGKVRQWIEPILHSGQPNGWFGPAQNQDRWPLAVAMKALTQYEEATGDPRVIPLLRNYFAHLRQAPPDWPDTEWRGTRAMENMITAFWLYRRTGDPMVLEVADAIRTNSFDWTGYFHDFPYTSKVLAQGLKFGQTFRTAEGQEKPFGHPSHVVNVAMAVKHPGVWYQRSRDERGKKASFAGIANLDRYHGQVGGRFSGDEHLGGRRPTQGTELCAVVEYMFSLSHLIAVFGDVELADRLEMLAYNGLPGTCTPDFWAHQYDQQANQVLVSRARREWTTNGDDANLYGLEPNYGCCTANMHQGWPKFVSHMWMATPDQGLAAVALGPNRVQAKVAAGTTVTITQETDYPFDGVIRFSVAVAQPTTFPLYVRVPAWADGASLTVAGRSGAAPPGSFAAINRTWKSGDEVTLTLPMRLRTETRYNQSVSILRGPVCFALRIGESYKKLQTHHEKLPAIDWEIEPTTAWNYGLRIDRSQPEKQVTVTIGKIGPIPFEGKAAPVVLKVRGRAVPEWTLVQNSAGDPPTSPVRSAEPLTELDLIPYGSTRLRVSEFPVLAE